MDLIYADETKKDIGVMMAYTLDIAYGTDENNFECVVDSKNHCCREHYYLYVEGEDYGGYIDSIKVDTPTGEITYSGRTWHGILEGKAICPDPGQDYAVFDGEANAVIQEIIDMVGLGDLFVASEEDSEIEVIGYQMERYTYAYTGIRQMLKASNAKLLIRWINGMVTLSAEPIYDYSQDEEFDTSQVDFTLKRNYDPVNHIICLGQGELQDRAVIHLFTDDGGGVQPYANVEDPQQDSDYILDTSQQVITGKDEITEVIDYPSASITTNYLLLTAKPSDWDANCEDYFSHEDEEDGGERFVAVRKNRKGYVLQTYRPYDWSVNYSDYYTRTTDEEDVDHYTPVRGTTTYRALTKRPSDWKTNYSDYYQRSGGEYVRVQGVNVEKYVRQAKRPKNWKKHFNEYYYLHDDSVVHEYRRVSGNTHEKYVRQTKRPTDWSIDFEQYYRKSTAKELKTNKRIKWRHVDATKKGTAPKWKTKTYYTRQTYETAPKWNLVRRYTLLKYKVAPSWGSGTYYRRITSAPPTWEEDTYYTNDQTMIAPEWVEDAYYRAVEDRYAVMIENALQRFDELWASDELSINLEETDQVYDIGDLVGCIEEITGITTVQEVTKKIIKITNNDVSINYEVS